MFDNVRTYLVRVVVRHFDDVYFVEIILNTFNYLEFTSSIPNHKNACKCVCMYVCVCVCVCAVSFHILIHVYVK